MLPPGVAEPGAVEPLATILADATADGVSAGFLAPLDVEAAARWWDDALRHRLARTWVAEHAGEIVGCVRLVPAGYPADPHRADVVKLLVRTDHRGHGHGRALMAALEDHATTTGRWLLTLTTESGRPAETMYERWAWQRYGHLDDHAAGPDGVPKPTTFFAKRLARPASAASPGRPTSSTAARPDGR